jgi:NADH dehydrogenase
MKSTNRFLLAAAAGAGVYAAARCEQARVRRRLAARVPADAPRVVVLGGGFAGLQAVKDLAASLAGRARIVLVDRQNYFLFTPMLYQAATGGVTFRDIVHPLRRLAAREGVQFCRAEVEGVDFNARRVRLDSGGLAYDYLVVALGSTTNYFGNDAVRAHTLPLKRIEDAIAIRNRLVDMLEDAAIEKDPAKRRAMLTVVVAGGGATGAETAAACAALFRRVIPRDYSNLDAREARVVLVEATSKLLGHMGAEIASIALAELRKMGVEVLLNVSAQSAAPGSLALSGGRGIEAGTIIWAAGVKVPEVVARMEAPHGPGGSLAVDEFLQVPGLDGVYAIGDSAHIAGLPLLAAAAMQQGKAAARNITRVIEGRQPVAFRYRNYGEVISLGPKAGAAEIRGTVIDGLAGWFMWRVVHLARLTSFRNKAASVLDWTAGYITEQDMTRLEVAPNYGEHSRRAGG